MTRVGLEDALTGPSDKVRSTHTHTNRLVMCVGTSAVGRREHGGEVRLGLCFLIGEGGPAEITPVIGLVLS